MKRFTNNDKSLIYIINSNYELLYFNKKLAKKIPGLKRGDYCYKKLGMEDKPCSNCPLRSSVTEDNPVFIPKFKHWYNVSTAEVDFDEEDCHLILANPIVDNVNKILANLANDFDALLEIDLADDYYRIVSEHEELGFNNTGSYSELINEVLLNKIDETEYNHFKEFSNSDILRHKLSESVTEGCSDEFRIVSSSNVAEYIQIKLIPIDIHNKNTCKAFCFIKFVNLNDIKKNNKSLTDIVEDPLTGLPKGSGYLFNVNEMIKQEPNGTYALIAIDIEHFKMYNEFNGNEAGDRFLRDIAKILRSFDNEYNSYSGYFGEDNFCTIVPNNKDTIEALEAVIIKYVKSIENGLGYLPAFGVYVIDDKSVAILQMYDRACIAVTRIKGNYSHRLCYYTPDMLEQMQEEHIVIHKVLNGLKNNEFIFYIQPQCNMFTGKIFAAEALVRWLHDGQLISPGKFIPILEKTGSVADLDRYLWEKVINWQKTLMDRGIKPVPISVNVSRMDIYQLDVASEFIGLVEKYNIEPSLVEIEITESAYIEGFDSIKSTVEKLRSYGFKILMDDFGSGYSSLNMLKNINVDVLKMDMRFLDIDNGKDGKGINILESVVNMIKSMDLPIITEGVETDNQKETLKEMGCRYAQGYLFYRPMPVEKFEEMLKDEDGIDYSGITVKKVEQIHVRELLNENLYSDTLINNILGAVAFFRCSTDKVELFRVNEGYYRLFGNEFIQNSEYRYEILEHFFDEDRKMFLTMLEEAYNAPLKGSSDDLRYWVDNKIVWLHTRVFYLNETSDSKIFYCSFEDVTEEKKKDEEVELLNKKLKSTLKLESIDSWEFDIETRRLIIFSPDKIISSNSSNGNRYVENFPESLVTRGVISQEIKLSIDKYFERCIAGKYDDQFILEIPFVINDNEVWLRIKGKPVYENDKVRIIVGSFRNVTRNVTAEAHNNGNKAVNILSENAMFSMYFNLSSGAIYSMTGELKWYDNVEVEKDYDVLIESLRKYSAIVEEDIELVVNLLQRQDLIDTYEKQSLVSLDYRTLENGEIKWKRLTVYMTDDTDNVYGHLFISNIDGFKAQRTQSHIITNTLEQLNCGFIRIDKETNEVVAYNSIILSLCGFQDGAELASHVKNGYVDTIYEDDFKILSQRRAELVNIGDSHTLEYRLTLPNDELRYLVANEVLLQDENDRIVIQRTIFDNTEIKKLEEELIHKHSMQAINAIKLSDENKAILMGLNDLYVSSYYCNIVTNKFKAMKYTQEVADLVESSNTFDAYMKNYAKKYVYFEDRDTFLEMTARPYIKKSLSKEKSRYSITYRRIIRGSYRWYRIDIIASTFNKTGKVENIIFAISDVDDAAREKEDYSVQIDYYKDLFFSACRDVYLGMVLIDLESLITKSLSFENNKILEAPYKGTWDQLYKTTIKRVDKPFKDIIERGMSPEKLRQAEIGSVNTYKYKINLGKGKKKFLWISTIIRILEQNGKKMATMYSMDITDDIQALEMIKYSSERDELTGLYNRHRLTKWSKGYNNLDSCAVLFLDINGLKITNDTFGHELGDVLIRTAAKSIKSILREGIHAYRYGGDEFIIIIDNPTIDDVNEIVKKWRTNLKTYNEDAKIKCNMSLGVAYTSTKEPLELLIAIADKEMYKQKINSRFQIKEDSQLIQEHYISSILKYMDGEYEVIFEIDLINDRYTVIHINENYTGVEIQREGVYSEVATAVIMETTAEESLQESLNVGSISYLRKNLIPNSRIVYTYKTKSNDFKQAEVVYQGIEFVDNKATKAILANKLIEG